MVIYNVLGCNAILWALSKVKAGVAVYVNSTDPGELTRAAKKLKVSPEKQQLIEYHHIWYLDDVKMVMGDAETVIIENVSHVLAQMPHTTYNSQNKSIIDFLRHCRLHGITVVMIESCHKHFFSLLLDLDITT